MKTNSQAKVLKQNKVPAQIQKTKEKQPQPVPAPQPAPQPQPLKTSKQSSFSSSSSVSQEETNATATTTQAKNYKDIQFDKVISSPVVDIADLRKLSWNGIPVSLFITV